MSKASVSFATLTDLLSAPSGPLTSAFSKGLKHVPSIWKITTSLPNPSESSSGFAVIRVEPHIPSLAEVSAHEGHKHRH